MRILFLSVPNMPARAPLDHLILLVSSLSSHDLSTFSEAGFDLIPGGTHADGLTQNVLITLQDGICKRAAPFRKRLLTRNADIELIAFCDGIEPGDHWWGGRQNGWIDWSLMPSPLSATERVNNINESVGIMPGYTAPKAGGRLNKQDQQLRWNVAFPIVSDRKNQQGEKRGRRPFFCEDLTPRNWRVSHSRINECNLELTSRSRSQVPPRTTQQPNGVVGVASLTLLSRPASTAFDAYVAALSAVLPKADDAATHQFELVSLHGLNPIRVYIRQAETEEERRWVEERGEGLYEIGLRLEKSWDGGPKLMCADAGARMILE